ncbi:FMN-binding protein [Taurinivorans muris]|uniref:Ion-translocating oxidoreductase complex subunit G n=1 Tax=Taurinivorans muris TaxID=2787751 RepID=A0ABY5Y1M6_9BACT|nr:FMN-binding protein [Desulfovibrionaceae bacterium LT0009]
MKSIIKMVSVLSVLCAVAGFILSYLKISTVTPIENQLLTYVQGPAILNVFKDVENSPIQDRKSFIVGDGKKVNVFPAIKDGKLFGVALEGFGQGFGGDIGVMVGIDVNNDTLVSIDITTHKETPGLGSRVSEESFTKQFKGKPYAVALKSQGGEIDAISGATVSSNGTVLAINDAGNQYNMLKDEIIKTWNSGAKNEFLQGIHQRAVE